MKPLSGQNRVKGSFSCRAASAGVIFGSRSVPKSAAQNVRVRCSRWSAMAFSVKILASACEVLEFGYIQLIVIV